jgi:hypothetical protein
MKVEKVMRPDKLGRCKRVARKACQRCGYGAGHDLESIICKANTKPSSNAKVLGFSGRPDLATQELGRALLKLRIDAASTI